MSTENPNVQWVAEVGPIDVQMDTEIVLIDQQGCDATTLFLPPASQKTCPVLIVPWVGGDGIGKSVEVRLRGASDYFPHEARVLTMENGESRIFIPIPGEGYACQGRR